MLKTYSNWITFLRILLIPVFLVLLLSQVKWGDFLALAVFALAALTDSIDGYIARLRKEETFLGKIFDPLADKLLVASALIALVGLGRLSSWIAMIIITREFFVSGLRLAALGQGGEIAVALMGRIKTVLQIVAIIAWILRPFFFNQAFGNFFILVTDLLMATALIFTVYSGIDYFLKFKTFLLNQSCEKK